MNYIERQASFIGTLLQSLKSLYISGYTEEVVTLSPKEYKETTNLPLDGSFYKLDELKTIVTQKYNLSMGLHFEPLAFFYGLPEICPVCGKPSTRYILYKSQNTTNRSTKGLVIDFSKSDFTEEEREELWDNLVKERSFLLVPFCQEHDTIEVFYENTLFMNIKPVSRRKQFFIKDPNYESLLAKNDFNCNQEEVISGIHVAPDSEDKIAYYRKLIKGGISISNFFLILLVIATIFSAISIYKQFYQDSSLGYLPFILGGIFVILVLYIAFHTLMDRITQGKAKEAGMRRLN